MAERPIVHPRAFKIFDSAGSVGLVPAIASDVGVQQADCVQVACVALKAAR